MGLSLFVFIYVHMIIHILIRIISSYKLTVNKLFSKSFLQNSGSLPERGLTCMDILKGWRGVKEGGGV